MQRFRPHHFMTRIVRGRIFTAVWPALVLYFALCTSSEERPIGRDVSTPDVFAQSALNTILGDLQQEIAAGSNATFYTDASGNALGSVYLPVNPAAAVPALALKGQQSVVTTFAANLVKRSAFQQNFFPANADAGAANYNNGNTAATVAEPSAPGATPTPYTAPWHPPSSRAANVSSAVVSQNGVAALPARWNKGLLLPKAAANSSNPNDLTPDSTRFMAPDWVLVSRDGSNPTYWSPGLQTSATNPASVVGRYAYAMYDEGGLLDLTSAGYASGTDSRQIGYKDSLGSADLTQAALTQAQVDALVSWRGGHEFAGRQDLISFFTQTAGTDTAALASLQNSLQYFGTFSRSLNQPSYAPVSRVASTTNQNPRPLIQPSAATGGQPGGGNNVGDNYTTAAQQDVFSPQLLAVRAEAAFTRNDGTTAAVVGEPLIKGRFALQRLAWLTYQGPSATRSLSDPDMQALINTYGITATYLQQGTAANIQRYFGLAWDATNRCWKYNVHNGGSASSAGTGSGAIMKLSSIADQKTREPDFFEILKTSVDAGALGKASTNAAQAEPGEPITGTHYEPLNFQFYHDVNVDAALIQLGANIIDQYDLDGYPTRIVFNDGTGAREFHGVENLPYIYRIRTGVLKARESIPASQQPPNGAGTAQTPYLHSGTQPLYTAQPLKDTGAGIVMAVPDIWNPHDQNSSLGSPRPGASGLIRLVANSAPPDTVYADTASNTPDAGYSTYTSGSFALTDSAHGLYRGTSFTDAVAPNVAATIPIPYFTRGANPAGTLTTASLVMSGSNGGFSNPHYVDTTNSTWLTFKSDATLFREPTLLGQADPTGPSGLTMGVDPANLDILNLQRSDSTKVYVNASPTYGLRSINTNPLGSPVTPASTQGYIGIMLGTYPLRWVGPRWSGSASGTLWNYTSFYLSDTGSPNSAVTYSLQYQDPVSSAWITYDEKYVDSDLTFEDPYQGLLVQPRGGAYAFVDPRTPRFGSPTEANIADSAHYRAPLTISPPSNWTSTWLDYSGKLLSVVTERPDISSGFGSNFRGTAYVDWGGYAAPGLHTQGIDTNAGVNGIFFQTGLLAQNDPNYVSSALGYGSDGYRFVGDTPGVGSRDGNFWSDPDGVVRRATGAYVTKNSATGQPLATATNISNGVGSPSSSGQSKSRPIILNRPFRSVAELGQVYSGNPWKNIDFSTPESGYSELLDVFCVNEPDPTSNVVAGKVNLNTRQPAVLRSILTGAYTDEENNFSGVTTPTPLKPLAATDADAMAGLLVKRTTVASPSNAAYTGSAPQPLQNVGDLVGRWYSKQTLSGNFTPSLGSVHNIDGSKSYDGFSADLATLTGGNLVSLSTETLKIPRMRESAIRALSNVGNTRVWNLLIDVIAQTGEYGTNTTGLDQFTVEGSQRYWLHIAVDRFTGDVLDQNLEAVPEVPPTDVTLSNNRVAEDRPSGATVGTLSGVGPNPASTYTYTLVSGTGSDDNYAFFILNSALRAGTPFHYLDKSAYSIRVRAMDQDGLSFEKTLAVTVVPGAYTQWKIANFAGQANDPTVAGDLVDADHDGTVNLLEYALGTSPTAADTPGISLQRDANGIEFNYTRSSTATDVTAHVYWTNDLTKPETWNTAGITETMLSDDGTIQHWQATLPPGSGQNVFLRLQVTKP